MSIRRQVAACAAVATNADIFDVVCPPELYDIPNMSMAAARVEDRELHTHRRRKNFHNTRVQVGTVADNFIADDDISHSRMLLDLHRADPRMLGVVIFIFIFTVKSISLSFSLLKLLYQVL